MEEDNLYIVWNDSFISIDIVESIGNEIKSRYIHYSIPLGKFFIENIKRGVISKNYKFIEIENWQDDNELIEYSMIIKELIHYFSEFEENKIIFRKFKLNLLKN